MVTHAFFFLRLLRKMGYKITGWGLVGVIAVYSCTSSPVEELTTVQEQPTFRKLTSERTDIKFSNNLQHTERLNAYTYRNFYNGAGVAVGDINNDGLVDIYIAGNQVSNKLYLNSGNLVFEDISTKAGVECKNVWSTGVSIADVNGDGFDDIYVCKSGPPEGPNRNNELFINNGDLTFTERAKEFGIDDIGLSHHAVFFDYDLDGDLDMYLLNNSLRSVGIYDLREGQRDIRDPEGGNKLYRNEGNRFTDVSEVAGIYGSSIGFGLGVTASDINKDGWPDLFVSNDFFERDYLYINQKDGTFKEMLEEHMSEISMGSMGADIADLTNDGYPEIYVTEMLPGSLERVKTKTVFEDWDRYQSSVKNGYYHQFTRNVLQLNAGPIPENPNQVAFHEVSRLTGTEATDWSWGALIFDTNNDGWKDIFIANGIYKDLTDQDYINFYSNTELKASQLRKDSTMLTSLIDKIPSVALSNHLYINNGNLGFEENAVRYGLADPGFSNGAVYADLDNDGDLDLLVNNVNAAFSVYENLASENKKGNSIQFNLKGPQANTRGFGTQIYVYTGGDMYFTEQQPVKGYMSTVDFRPHIGMGSNKKADSIKIIWPDHTITLKTNISANQILELDYNKEIRQSDVNFSPSSHEPWLNANSTTGLEMITHSENEFIDFNRDRLLFEMYSNEGPKAVVGDINGDGLDDVVMGGSAGFSTRVFLQDAQGKFKVAEQPVFEQHIRSEDTALLLTDVDNDNDLDLLVGSGGNEFSYNDSRLLDRLYVNDGNGNFTYKEFGNAVTRNTTAFIKSIDFDLDGDVDLLTGSRLQPFNYGVPVDAYLWENDGQGNYTNVTEKIAPELISLGLLTDAVVLQDSPDKIPEFIIIGEYMPPFRFSWKDDRYVKKSVDAPSGLWKSARAVDLNRDGALDIVLGNYGLNTRFNITKDKPLTLFIGDYDGNGSREHLLTMYVGDSLYPLALLQDLMKQLPMIRKSFATFDSYKDATIYDILTPDMVEEGLKLEATSLESGILMWEKDRYVWSPLPVEAQIAPVFAIFAHDLNGDSAVDLILGGNQTRAKPELGIYNASKGVVLQGNGKGEFKAVNPSESGFFVKGEVRDLVKVRIGNSDQILVIINSDFIKIYK
jgi:enediyne biosynthesis protein E4